MVKKKLAETAVVYDRPGADRVDAREIDRITDLLVALYGPALRELGDR